MEPLSVGAMQIDFLGIRHYPLQSSYQRRANADGSPAFTDLRIIEPDRGVGYGTRFLYVLPVQAGTPESMPGQWTAEFGDGISTMRALDVANVYDAVVVEPGFNAVDPTTRERASGPAPWYGDHPNEPEIRQESYLVRHVVPTVDRLYPAALRRRFLLGYSKSGWGSIGLLMRHPALFEAVAAWDAPLMMRAISPVQFADEDIVYGRDNAYFEREYRIDTRIGSADALKSRNRLWIGANGPLPVAPGERPYDYDFPLQTADFARTLDRSGVQYTIQWQSRPHSHSWSPTVIGGYEVYWETAAVAFLMGRDTPTS